MPPCRSVSLTPLFLDSCHFCGTGWVRGDIPVLLLALGEKLSVLSPLRMTLAVGFLQQAFIMWG